jgi:hypothetical protein
MAVAMILTHLPLSAVQLQFIEDEISDLAQDLMHDEPGMLLFGPTAGPCSC